MAVLLITRVISVRLANPLRPAITQLMSAALTDVRLTVLAARLAKLANRLLCLWEVRPRGFWHFP